MDGTILAAVLIGFALRPALLALNAYQERKDAAPAQKGRRERFVTPDELEERLSEEAKKMQWANEEWHEKFSTLHARLSKRAQRRENPEPELELVHDEDAHGSNGVLANRRLGSV